jgi:hypothetical protein
MQSAIEVTQEEYEGRKISHYGKISSYIDAISVALIFAITTAIVTTMIPESTNAGQIQFWLAFETLLVIFALKKLEKIWNPLDFYQTVIIRK